MNAKEDDMNSNCSLAYCSDNKLAYFGCMAAKRLMDWTMDEIASGCRRDCFENEGVSLSFWLGLCFVSQTANNISFSTFRSPFRLFLICGCGLVR